MLDEIEDNLKKLFDTKVKNSEKAAALLQQLNNGATYQAAYDYADEIGLCLEDALREVLSIYVDGFTENLELLDKDEIFKFLCGTPTEAYTLAQSAAEIAQTNANTEAGIGMKALGSQLLKYRLNEDADKVAGLTIEDAYQEILSIGRSLPGNAPADTMQKNAEFQSESGLSPKIVRTMNGETCAMCVKLAGTYDYPCDKKVYVRHPGCDCSVNYFPRGTGSGKYYQNIHGSRSVWSKT